MRRDLTQRFSARVLEVFGRGPTAEGVRISAAKDGGPAEILIYDVIGADFWGEGVTAKGVLAALTDAGGDPVRVRVNSPGGDVFEGLAIANALRGYAGEVSVVVDGLAASAASVIALAGTALAMNDGSMFMIHNAWTLAIGDRNAMTKQAGTLAKVDGQLAGMYAAASGRPVEEMAAAMDAETWYTAAEAVEAGFAASVVPAPERPKAASDTLTQTQMATAIANQTESLTAELQALWSEVAALRQAAPAPTEDSRAVRARRLRIARAAD